MMQKPITVARNDYMAALCNITNQSNLPAFVIVDVLAKFSTEMEKLVEAELKRDTANYRQALEKEHSDAQKEQEGQKERSDVQKKQERQKEDNAENAAFTK